MSPATCALEAVYTMGHVDGLAEAMALAAGPLLRLLGHRAYLSREVINASYGSFRYSSARAESELAAHFRPAERAWRDTLAAERAARRS